MAVLKLADQVGAAGRRALPQTLSLAAAARPGPARPGSALCGAAEPPGEVLLLSRGLGAEAAAARRQRRGPPFPGCVCGGAPPLAVWCRLPPARRAAADALLFPSRRTLSRPGPGPGRAQLGGRRGGRRVLASGARPSPAAQPSVPPSPRGPR